MYPPTYILLVAVMAVVHVDGSPLIKYDKTLTIKATTVETLPPLHLPWTVDNNSNCTQAHLTDMYLGS
jgi:hypothetical protein